MIIEHLTCSNSCNFNAAQEGGESDYMCVVWFTVGCNNNSPAAQERTAPLLVGLKYSLLFIHALRLY